MVVARPVKNRLSIGRHVVAPEMVKRQSKSRYCPKELESLESIRELSCSSFSDSDSENQQSEQRPGLYRGWYMFPHSTDEEPAHLQRQREIANKKDVEKLAAQIELVELHRRDPELLDPDMGDLDCDDIDEGVFMAPCQRDRAASRGILDDLLASIPKEAA